MQTLEYELEFNEHTHTRMHTYKRAQIVHSLANAPFSVALSIEKKTDRFRLVSLNINLRARTRFTRETEQIKRLEKICNQ